MKDVSRILRSQPHVINEQSFILFLIALNYSHREKCISGRTGGQEKSLCHDEDSGRFLCFFISKRVFTWMKVALTKIPHEHVPKSHVITCDFGTCSCGIFVMVAMVQGLPYPRTTLGEPALH